MFFTPVEAEATFDYEAQQDDELTLKVGDVITDITQVGCGGNSPAAASHCSFLLLE